MADLKIKSKFFNQEDVVEVKDEEVNPIIEKVIQADKDIISQIEIAYDEESGNSTLSFPKYLVPIYICLPQTGPSYFDYTDENVLDGRENVVATIDVDYDNEKITLVIDEEISIEDISSVLCLNCSTSFGNDEQLHFGNWYAILNPQSGTKLYKHSITWAGGGPFPVIITNSSTEITKQGSSMLNIQGEIITWASRNFYFIPAYNTFFQVKSLDYSTGAFSDVSISGDTVADTVTEL